MLINQDITVQELMDYLKAKPADAKVFVEDRDLYRHPIDELYVSNDDRDNDIIAPEHAYDKDTIVIGIR